MKPSISNIQSEGHYQASKWLKIQALLDPEEMEGLFLALQEFWIFPLSGIHSGEEIAHRTYIQEYRYCIESLKKGEIPAAKILACCFTDDLNSLWLQEVGPQKFLTKIRKPVVQVQTHYFTYSKIDRVFRPMSMGKESIFWGVQFSFPQIFQDPKTMDLLKVVENGMFQKIRKWIRDKTVATPFEVDGEKKRVPIRIGKKCFPWIHSHPQLAEQKILCMN